MKIRTMTRGDLALTIDWAASEGWNPGLDDAATFLASDPEGFFVAEQAGQPVAAISVVNHSVSFSFLGLYICIPEFRRQGIGYALWKRALEHAGSRTVGLDGVEAQQDNYRKSGFVLTGRTERYEGVVKDSGAAKVEPMAARDLDGLIEMEAKANGYRKQAFLRNWLKETDTRQTFTFRGDSRPIAFATMRQCRVGYKIGPLVAPNSDAAAELLRHAATVADGEPIIIDVPQESAGLHAICKSLGMEVSFRTARMYRGQPPSESGLEYAVSTLELG
jgi:GNAT superfamily N-acetyltransferase